MQGKQWIIFGAGQTGRAAFEKCGKEAVYCFCDNFISGECCGKKIINMEGLASIPDKENYYIDIAVDDTNAAFDIKEQLAYLGMTYEHWSGEQTIRRLLLKVRKNGGI